MKNQMDSEPFNSLENAPNFKSVWDNCVQLRLKWHLQFTSF